MIEELDYVELTEDCKEYPKGSQGTVVYVSGTRKHCFVEFFKEGKTIGVEIVEIDKLKNITVEVDTFKKVK